MDNLETVACARRAFDRVFEVSQPQSGSRNSFPDEVYRHVGIPRVRILKRRFFSQRLFAALFHLSCASLAECLGVGATTIQSQAIDREELDYRWKIYLEGTFVELAHFNVRDDEGAKRLAMWVLNTSQESQPVHYLADRLQLFSGLFRSEDLSVARRMKDEASFASLWRLTRAELSRDRTPIEEAFAGAVAQRVADARSYRSQAVCRDRGDLVEWRHEFVSPHHHHVKQAGNEQFDEWITIGADHYWNMGVAWVGPIDNPAATATRQALNDFLHLDKAVALLRGFSCVESITCEQDVATYAVLTYEIDSSRYPPEFAMWIDEFGGHKLDVSLWIERDSGLPVKIAIAAGDWQWEQVFTGFGEALEIVVPQAAMRFASGMTPDDHT